MKRRTTSRVSFVAVMAATLGACANAVAQTEIFSLSDGFTNPATLSNWLRIN